MIRGNGTQMWGLGVVAALAIGMVGVGGPASAARTQGDVLTSTISVEDVPGPIVGGGQTELLPIAVTATTKGKGFALVRMPAPQIKDGISYALGDIYPYGDGEQPQTADPSGSGYVNLSRSTCATATLVTVDSAGFEVKYDCAAGQGFTVNYSPRLGYQGFDGGNDVWTFGLAHRARQNKPWTTQSSTNSIQLTPAVVEPPNVVFEAPMSLIDVTAYATGYNFTLVSTDRTSPPVEAVVDLPGRLNVEGTLILEGFTTSGAALEMFNPGALTSVQQQPLVIWDCAGQSNLTGPTMPVTGVAVPESWDVTGNSFFDEIAAANHPFVAGDRVQFANRYGGDGLSNDIVYYVVSPDQDNETFKLALTRNGAPVDFTTDIGIGILIQGNVAANTLYGDAPANGSRLSFTAMNGGSGLNLNTDYFVVNSGSGSFQLAASPGGAVLPLGSRLRPTTTYVMKAPVEAALNYCDDSDDFGAVSVFCPSAAACYVDGVAYEGFSVFSAIGAHGNLGGGNFALTDCVTAGGQFISTLQELPDSPALADWRCDFLASRGLTLTGLDAIINGWEDEYGKVGTCPGSEKVIAVDNYVNGNGNDYIWCPHVVI